MEKHEGARQKLCFDIPFGENVREDISKQRVTRIPREAAQWDLLPEDNNDSHGLKPTNWEKPPLGILCYAFLVETKACGHS
uniref:Uncharacterized protein n=1 Tax=Vespula pensylvanica TaxID=30213 RepID=A0A834U913_VESPE|nr:hypothetical protein H0235_009952 [Vespula pensylvanica]